MAVVKHGQNVRFYPTGVPVLKALKSIGVKRCVVTLAESLGKQVGGERVSGTRQRIVGNESVTVKIPVADHAVGVKAPAQGIINIKAPLAGDMADHIMIGIIGYAGLPL